MSNKKKLIAIYKAAFKTGRLPFIGLCTTLVKNEIEIDNLKMFHPTGEDMVKLREKNMAEAFWGSGLHVDNEDRYLKFTTLRQTLLAFLIAMEEN